MILRSEHRTDHYQYSLEGVLKQDCGLGREVNHTDLRFEWFPLSKATLKANETMPAYKEGQNITSSRVGPWQR